MVHPGKSYRFAASKHIVAARQALESDTRFALKRARGVEQFWKEERLKLKGGEAGSRNWTSVQRDAILRGVRPVDDAGKTIEGHHLYSAQQYPSLADNPQNVVSATRAEHQHYWHGGDFRNPTDGVPLNPNYKAK